MDVFWEGEVEPETGVVGDSEGVVGASAISSPASDGKTDGSGGPKHSPEEPSEGPTSGNLLHSRNVGHPTSVFSSMTFSQPERAASQRLRHGGTVVLSSLLPYSLTQNGK